MHHNITLPWSWKLQCHSNHPSMSIEINRPRRVWISFEWHSLLPLLSYGCQVLPWHQWRSLRAFPGVGAKGIQHNDGSYIKLGMSYDDTSFGARLYGLKPILTFVPKLECCHVTSLTWCFEAFGGRISSWQPAGWKQEGGHKSRGIPAQTRGLATLPFPEHFGGR